MNKARSQINSNHMTEKITLWNERLALPQEMSLTANDESGRLRLQRTLLQTGLTLNLAWTRRLLTHFFPQSANPESAAAAFARRYEDCGLLHSALIDCQEATIGNGPLCASWMEQYDVDGVAYALEQRFSGESKPTRIYWPSETFARRFGSWTGAACYPCPHKVSHDLLVTEVWLRFLKTRPQVALTAWTSERELQWTRNGQASRGPTPDALITESNSTLR